MKARIEMELKAVSSYPQYWYDGFVEQYGNREQALYAVEDDIVIYLQQKVDGYDELQLSGEAFDALERRFAD